MRTVILKAEMTIIGIKRYKMPWIEVKTLEKSFVRGLCSRPNLGYPKNGLRQIKNRQKPYCTWYYVEII
jgi:hypothetical protein